MDYMKREKFRALEQYNYNILGIHPEMIIENAAQKVISNIDIKNRETFAVVCGIASNGAYGLAIARNLISLGKFVDIYIVENIKEASEEFKIQYNILLKMNANINYLETIEELENFNKYLNRVNTIIDAISGIEFEMSFQGTTEFIIDIINKSRIYTISVDIPSGMDFDTGKAHISMVRSDLVVCFEGLKNGLTNNTGLNSFRVVVENIGFIKEGRNVRHKTY